MIEPAEFDRETIPAVFIGGREWPIPELVWRDLRKCRQELIELNARVGEAVSASRGPEDESEIDRGARNMVVLAQVFRDLSNDDFERLVMAPIHVGLCAASPALTRDEFFGWRTTEIERQLAWLTVRRQSGLFIFQGETTQSGEGSGAQSPS